MQLGYNHNVRYNGNGYHIQTEDSGRATMYVTTLLFTGGTIVASKKTCYRTLSESDNFTDDMLRELMKNQHKSMLSELIHGAFDLKEDLMQSDTADTLSPFCKGDENAIRVQPQHKA